MSTQTSSFSRTDIIIVIGVIALIAMGIAVIYYYYQSSSIGTITIETSGATLDLEEIKIITDTTYNYKNLDNKAPERAKIETEYAVKKMLSKFKHEDILKLITIHELDDQIKKINSINRIDFDGYWVTNISIQDVKFAESKTSFYDIKTEAILGKPIDTIETKIDNLDKKLDTIIDKIDKQPLIENEDYCTQQILNNEIVSHGCLAIIELKLTKERSQIIQEFVEKQLK